MDWNDARPLRSGPGRALAMEVRDAGGPAQAHALVTGALEGLGGLLEPSPFESREGVELALTGYLRGLAAVAIVADNATGARLWTSAADFALGGEQVEFLEPHSVLLGTLTLAFTAVNRAMDLVPVLDAHAVAPPLPFGFHTVLVDLQRQIAGATQARMTQMSERAEEAYGG